MSPTLSGPLIQKAYKAGFYLQGFNYSIKDGFLIVTAGADNKVAFKAKAQKNNIDIKSKTDKQNPYKPVKNKISLKIVNNEFNLEVDHVGGLDGAETSSYSGTCTLIPKTRTDVVVVAKAQILVTDWTEQELCQSATFVDVNGEYHWAKTASNAVYVQEAQRRALTCGVTNLSTASATVTSSTVASTNQPLTTSSTTSKPAIQVAEASSSSVGIVSDGGTTTFSSSHTKWRNAQSPEQAQAFVNEIQASIVMYMAIYGVIEQQPPTLKDRVLSVVDAEITRLRAEKELLQQQLSQRFSTPIRPTNANLTVSAFRAADTFPKIPFYIPGTNEIGEMLVIPRVTDEGFLKYQFDFLDPTATYDKVRDSLSIPHENVDDVIGGLQKVDAWTKVAQENNVNRRVEKTSACVPANACIKKKQGISSSEIIFQVYEDGSTAGRIQRNKGLFSVGYNMSVESSILLSAYLTYMRDVGAKEFKVGIMSDEEVIKLFD